MKVAAVQFRDVGKNYYFSYEDIDLIEKTSVVVETVKGIEVGKVYQIKEILDDTIISALKPILRIADKNDLDQVGQNQLLEETMIQEVKNIVQSLALEMKVLAVEYTLDRKKVTVHFEAEQRIDFRQLVKVLSENYKTKIELRQVSPRDAAKMIGGIGPCGLILCCQTFIGEFDAVSIKMAKNQSIALNPQKISGVCGKLLCCIKYEDDVYSELRETLPDVGEKVKTELGLALVLQINILGQKIKVRYLNEDSPIAWLHIGEVKRLNA